MSNFSDYSSELTNVAAGKFVCTSMTMVYLDGGTSERYTADVIMANGERKTIAVTMPGNTNRQDIFTALVAVA